jgi:hypothetical protein
MPLVRGPDDALERDEQVGHDLALSSSFVGVVHRRVGPRVRAHTIETVVILRTHRSTSTLPMSLLSLVLR